LVFTLKTDRDITWTKIVDPIEKKRRANAVGDQEIINNEFNKKMMSRKEKYDYQFSFVHKGR